MRSRRRNGHPLGRRPIGRSLPSRRDYFATELNASHEHSTENFAEGLSGEMDLPEDDINAVTALVNLLYRGKICEKMKSTLLSIYFLAEKICFSELMDRAMFEIRRINGIRGQIFCQTCIKLNTHVASRLRLYTVATAACYLARQKVTTETHSRDMLGFLLLSLEFSMNCSDFHVRYRQRIPSNRVRKGYDRI